MFDKFVENIMLLNPPKHLQTNNRVREPSRDLTDLKMQAIMQFSGKAKLGDDDGNRLMVSIWETESTFEMFDYENKTIKTTSYKMDNSNHIFMANLDKRSPKCILTKPNTMNDNTFCGTVEKIRGTHYFTPSTRLECFKVLVPTSKDQTYIKAGDLIRIGRMRYFVKEAFDGLKLQEKEFERTEKAQQLNIESLKQGTCKFCLCDENDNPDLLISPCSCKGSCAQVHLECLKQWLSNKVSRKSTSFVDFLNFDNFSCQLCKDNLPTSMRIDGKMYNMLSEPVTSKDPYIVLEGIPNQKSSTRNNMTVKINFKEKKSLVVGRGHQSDVRLQDVSISRQHCIIKFWNGKFWLNDNGSKFGTLIKLEPNQKASLYCQKIQIGRIVLQVGKGENLQTGQQAGQSKNKFIELRH